ncbi:origin of replication complex subunit 6-like isoform X2 [Iris pallida]|uniref:Origin of replication complex subunit 6 n=1 Tax=Iris pallida TaxID=29817 RepID=A0AAX6F676_IRIPA|nr:origin of replication complex subunit 6-like isoform X2 [Iris pallida]
MDVSSIATRLGLVGSGSGSKTLIRKAEELRRLSDLRFDSAAIGVGEVCKAIICLEIAATRMNVLFDRQSAIKMSGMSEKAYTRSFNMMQNGLGIKASLDVRELAIQFGCVRLIPFVNKGLALYKERFLDALPASRRATTDFNRPVFTVVAFYLCAKRHKLKADKLKLIELCGTSESEFATVSTSMKDLCYDAFGISKEKKDPKAVKQHRELLDALPGKRSRETDGDLSDTSSADNEDALENNAMKTRESTNASTCFFSWFTETQQDNMSEVLSDEVADLIKEDLWPNPLKYFNNEADEEDFDEDDDDDEKGTDEDEDDNN